MYEVGKKKRLSFYYDARSTKYKNSSYYFPDATQQ